MDTKGITKAKKIDKIGMNSSDTGLIFFDNVIVPQKYVIGEIGQGFIYQMLQFQEERLAAAAGSLTPLQVVLNETIDYTRHRVAFGKPLLDNQYIHFRLSELQTEIELVRSLLYQAADAMLKGQDVSMQASMLKLKCGRLAREVTDSCLQFGVEWATLMMYMCLAYTVTCGFGPLAVVLMKVRVSLRETFTFF